MSTSKIVQIGLLLMSLMWCISEASAQCEWRNTGGCSATGPREPQNDRSCDMPVYMDNSGFCDCNGNNKLDPGEYSQGCPQRGNHTSMGFTCTQKCAAVTPPPPPPPPAGPQSIGCFKDRDPRDLGGYSFSAPNMTTEICVSTCAQKGFAYAGTQFSSQCFCGNAYGSAGAATNCNMNCAGNAKEVCGGSWANNVYKTGVAAAPAPAPTGPAATATVQNGKVKVNATTKVQGATISPAQLKEVIAWMASEYGLVNEPVCWKANYDRGVGTIPSCPAGKEKLGALCYDPCRAGYDGNGTPTCLQKSCPSGYTDTGLMCHYNGSSSYSPVHWDSGAGICLFGRCTGGLVEDGCRGGYHKTASVCYLDVPPGMGGTSADPTKGSYTRSASGATSCDSSRNFEAGLCYLKPRDGYSCAVTACQQHCASGTVDCGPAACAKDKASCGMAIGDMVLSPLTMMMNVVPGAGTAAGEAARTASTAAKAAKAAEAAGKASDALSAGVTFANLVTGMMQAASNNLAAASTPFIADQVAAKYGKGSANYQTIARAWGLQVAMITIQQTMQDVNDMIQSEADPSGITATILAFNKPKCEQHEPIP